MSALRIVEESDLPVLIATFPESGAPPINRHLERFRRQQTGDVTCLAAWDAAIPIGYLFVRWPGRSGGLTAQALALGCAELGDLFVVDHARGRGVGRKLLEVAETLIVGRGISLVGLEVTATNPYNDIARALYERLGYRDAGFGEFISGYAFWDATGVRHRDEELYRYLTKRL